MGNPKCSFERSQAVERSQTARSLSLLLVRLLCVVFALVESGDSRSRGTFPRLLHRLCDLLRFVFFGHFSSETCLFLALILPFTFTSFYVYIFVIELMLPKNFHPKAVALISRKHKETQH